MLNLKKIDIFFDVIKKIAAILKIFFTIFNHPYIKNLCAKFQVKSPPLSLSPPSGRSQDLQDPGAARVKGALKGSNMTEKLHYVEYQKILSYF